jgi:hypothetical protein
MRSPDENAATWRSFDEQMMVWLEISVECSAKIAMSALRSGAATMGLLPNHVLARRIFLGARVA